MTLVATFDIQKNRIHQFAEWDQSLNYLFSVILINQFPELCTFFFKTRHFCTDRHLSYLIYIDNVFTAMLRVHRGEDTL